MEPDAVRRRRYRLVPWLVRALVPAARPGSYLLFTAGEPVYAGRSDTDLRRRLLVHAHDNRADYFDFDQHFGAHAAFLTECATFHAVVDTLENRIHPAAPARSGERCPFCRADSLATLNDRLTAEILKEAAAPRPNTN